MLAALGHVPAASLARVPAFACLSLCSSRAPTSGADPRCLPQIPASGLSQAYALIHAFTCLCVLTRARTFIHVVTRRLPSIRTRPTTWVCSCLKEALLCLGSGRWGQRERRGQGGTNQMVWGERKKSGCGEGCERYC